MNKIFIDSNIILYLMDSALRKRSIAQGLILTRPYLNAQVLTEVANVCKRRFKYNKEHIISLWSDLIADCAFMDTNQSSFRNVININ